jgi:hypothetical protein
MREGRKRRVAELAAEGKRINTGHNGGRYPKGWPRTAEGKPVKRENPTPSVRQRLEEARARWEAVKRGRKEQLEIGRLLRLVYRGAENAVSRRRDPALIARAREAVREVERKWWPK